MSVNSTHYNAVNILTKRRLNKPETQFIKLPYDAKT